jgi:hypothetical protein
MAINIGQIGNTLTTLLNAGLTPAQAVSTFQSITGSGSLATQVHAKLETIAVLVNAPEEYNAAAPGVVSQIEALPGIPPSTFPLLSGLRVFKDALSTAQLIQAVEAEVTAA